WDSGNEERLRAALERLRGMQGSGRLPFHIILHHGNVAVGSVPTLGERSLHGAEVAFAFRMLDTAASQRQRVLLSEPAARLLGLPEEPVHAFQCALKGFEGLRSFFVPAPPRGA
ncbi:MAG: hypothetical protein JNG86_13105, partial [Verrucomicrobiaceae bacterium]|nr:hypothetical protein [Verrucomicrobiaceae bacterium]